MGLRIRYFSPSKHERVPFIKNETEVFGMGDSAARHLAAELNGDEETDLFVIYGTAGGLNPKTRTGDVHVFFERGTHNIKFVSRSLPAFRVFEKSEIFQQTGADCIDCESAFFLETANERTKSRTVIIRGVIDDGKEDVICLERFRVKWFSLWKPSVFKSFVSLVKNFGAYQKSMNHFLKNWSAALVQ